MKGEDWLLIGLGLAVAGVAVYKFRPDLLPAALQPNSGKGSTPGLPGTSNSFVPSGFVPGGTVPGTTNNNPNPNPGTTPSANTPQPTTQVVTIPSGVPGLPNKQIIVVIDPTPSPGGTVPVSSGYNVVDVTPTTPQLPTTYGEQLIITEVAPRETLQGLRGLRGFNLASLLV